MQNISMSDAKSRFSELISRAASGERIVIQRRERAVAVLISPADLEKLDHAAQSARRLALALGQDAGLLDQIGRGKAHPAMAGFGLWAEEPDLEDLVEKIYQTRQSAPRRRLQEP